MNQAPDREMTFGNSPYVVFRVQITPDVLESEFIGTTTKWRVPSMFKNASPRIRESKKKGYEYEQTYTHSARQSEWEERYRRSGLSKLVNLDNAGNKKSLQRYNKIRSLESMPDTFIIVVGVIDKAAYHEGIDMRAIERDEHGDAHLSKSDRVWHGKDYSYEDFFKILCDVDNGQFDPLAIYRSPSNREKIEKRILDQILKVLKKDHPSKNELNDLTRRMGRSLRDDVRDYIRSGGKPPISATTEDLFRPAKRDVNDGLYGFGDGGSLIETGQLLYAIDYDVFTEQSSHMRSFVHRLLREHDNEIKRLKEAERQKRIADASPVERHSGKTRTVSKPRKSDEDYNLEYDLKALQLSSIKEEFLKKRDKYGRASEYWPEAEREWYNKTLKLVNSINAWMATHGRRI